MTPRLRGYGHGSRTPAGFIRFQCDDEADVGFVRHLWHTARERPGLPGAFSAVGIDPARGIIRAPQQAGDGSAGACSTGCSPRSFSCDPSMFIPAAEASGIHRSTRELDWVSTIWQSSRRIREVLSSLRPTFRISSVADLSAEFLLENGISACIWDVDGTLTPCRADHPPEDVEIAFRRLAKDPRLRHVIVSNCGEARFRDLGSIFPSVPVVRIYHSGERVVRRRLHRGEEWASDAQSDSLPLRPLRKPDPAVVRAALDELGGAGLAEVVLVGDQCLTDVAAANLGGIRSIKVETMDRRSFPLPVRLLQCLDRALDRLLSGA